MVVENIAGERFASGRTAQQKGNLAIGDGLFGQIVINNQSILAAVTEVLTDAASGVCRNVLQGGGVGGAAGDHAGVRQRVVLFESFHNLRHRGFFLADGDIDTFDAGILLANDRIHADGRFADLAVADDQFALTASDRRHGVDGFKACIHRLVDRLTLNHAGGNHFNTTKLTRLDGSLAVQRSSRGIDDASEKSFTDGHLSNLAGPLDDIPFFNVGHFSQNCDTDVVRFEIENHAQNTARELKKFHGHRVLNAVNACDTVTDGQDSSRFAYIKLFLIAFNLLRNNLTDFFRLDCFHALSCLP